MIDNAESILKSSGWITDRHPDKDDQRYSFDRGYDYCFNVLTLNDHKRFSDEKRSLFKRYNSTIAMRLWDSKKECYYWDDLYGDNISHLVVGWSQLTKELPNEILIDNMDYRLGIDRDFKQ